MASNPTDPPIAGEFKKNNFRKFFFNKNSLDDDEYQVQYEDEEDDERTIEEEEQLGSDDEQDELNDLENVKIFVFLLSMKSFFIELIRVRICLWKNYLNYMVRMLQLSKLSHKKMMK
jgi:hypothetical protein